MEKELEENSSNDIIETMDSAEPEILLNTTESTNISNIIDSNPLEENTIKIVGLYDPEENGLDIDLWINSDGEEIKLILNNINKMSLSKDAQEILEIALLTNSYFPEKKYYRRGFYKF